MSKDDESIMNPKDFIEYSTWIYCVGRSQRSLELLEKELETFVNREDFDGKNEYHKIVLHAYLEIQFIRTAIDF